MKIGLFGCGTIGSGVKELVERMSGIYDIEITKIFDLPTKREVLGKLFAENKEDIIEDDEISCVVEAMGGEKLAYQCISGALKAGKSVVTSNKEVVSNHFFEFLNLAKENKCNFLFEASVGGGIPIVRSLIENVKVNEVSRIYGIINGTTNYILTAMSEQGMTFDEALLEAKRLGFAEANPTNDIEGIDMVRKITILSMIAYGGEIDVNSVYHSGIGAVDAEIIKDIEKRGYELKFVAESTRKEGKVFIGVEPVLLLKRHPLSNVRDEYNAIMFEASTNGNLMFYGKGAGKLATATAILSDIMQIYEGRGELSLKSDNKFSIADNRDNSVYYIVKKSGKTVVEKLGRLDEKEVLFKARIFED